jgi:hypothetical protein
VLDEQRYAITRYRVTLRVHDGGSRKFALADGEAWLDADAVMALAMPAPFRRVIGRLLAEI